ncbi:Na+/H+ antiporter subunit G [Noviherbaspirillum aerium]|uniref:Na+/H+ antiporter subunit G n=1 Tax=Noviherbaspirillum aerium TaxID=2588497 RepID=UPI00124DDFE0|nr:Na+/H+ antiporter subunit G [Noviherbaspirillum aerium]
MSFVIELVVSAFLLLGAAFALIGSWGLVKLPDFYTRLHGPSKASTLGVGGILMASIIYFAARGMPGLHELLITLFLFISTPVSAYLLARAALHLKLKSIGKMPPGQDNTLPRK